MKRLWLCKGLTAAAAAGRAEKELAKDEGLK